MVKELVGVASFDELVKTGVSVVDFNATWCGPCKMLHPNFEEVSNELSDYRFISIDVDKNQELSARFNVRAVPTIVVLKDGKLLKATAGYMDSKTLKNFIEGSLR
ncbi:MAG: thioredoxin family protein [Bacilli bacterium]|jgi:thioredoxin 1